MFRKIVLSTVAALGLSAAVVAPTQAYPHYPHPQNPYPHSRHHQYHRSHDRPFSHREFCSWAEASAWMRFQRAHGYECYFEWHGPNCWVFYR